MRSHIACYSDNGPRHSLVSIDEKRLHSQSIEMIRFSVLKMIFQFPYKYSYSNGKEGELKTGKCIMLK